MKKYRTHLVMALWIISLAASAFISSGCAARTNLGLTKVGGDIRIDKASGYAEPERMLDILEQQSEVKTRILLQQQLQEAIMKQNEKIRIEDIQYKSLMQTKKDAKNWKQMYKDYDKKMERERMVTWKKENIRKRKELNELRQQRDILKKKLEKIRPKVQPLDVV